MKNKMKKVLIVFTIILTAFLAASCSTLQYEVINKYDKFNGLTTQSMNHNFMESDKFIGGRYAFDIARFSDKEHLPFYILFIDYIGSDWVFISKGESLVMLLDGKKLTFTGDGGFEDRHVYDGTVQEIASYKITQNDLFDIVNAKKIEVRVYGDDYNADLYFSAENKKRVNDFYLKYIIND